MSRRRNIDEFYALLGNLERATVGKRLVADCHGSLPWPRRGVCFFFEPGECRADNPSALRVVRVGTHGVSAHSKSTLWNRLSAHRGSVKTGGGNQRGSIFRRLVGTALMKRDRMSGLERWLIGANAPKSVRLAEHPVEQMVSEHIGRMYVLCLPVDDEPGAGSLRAYIERNSIALLSNAARRSADVPSANWLGHDCRSELVRSSGLWNNKHVEEVYDPAFLHELAGLVRAVGP